MKQLKINSEIISGGFNVFQRDLPTERYENNWEQAKTSTEVENV